MARESGRMSAEERRESVIRAAVVEFGRAGYAGTSTAAIAKRVGVSQPYLFRLFPDKRAIFLAAARRSVERMRRRFEQASEGLAPQEAHDAMCRAYPPMIADRDDLLFQMQMYVAVSAREGEGDEEFGAEIRALWAETWDSIRDRLGGDPQLTRDFFGIGMLINVSLAMGFPEGHRVWETLDIFEQLPASGGGSEESAG
ncbi:TetR/AcrR family transcriptional regulator [Streptomyces sp. DSM 44915]|uniref:TetR/AcrR family transcriptional regulator n=1 Tax=Streptomyces chisholmiae TaxID=3075540 RepID=A0ABU2JSK0_9ACTN|nr:TetR/AcrR family transcriptional regulator [Streptomyces sp. DSM 44915]MDT0267726.1 TetR/AcrR family transcriptional regulator [Streptomyces sp. DSM 44915]